MINPINVKKEWFILDASGQTLGKVATTVADVLRGKNKVTFTPHVDMGDNVIVINAGKVILASDKEDKKMYYSHSGYPGGFRARSAREQREHKPASLVELAVKGMVPHTILGRKQLRHLFVYEDDKHEQAAQKPKKLEVY